jgi:hypothetical protein
MSILGGVAPSQRTAACAFVTAAPIGWFTSCAIDADSCPMIETWFACVNPIPIPRSRRVVASASFFYVISRTKLLNSQFPSDMGRSTPPCYKALRIVWNSSSSLKGLPRNATAPACIACRRDSLPS